MNDEEIGENLEALGRLLMNHRSTGKSGEVPVVKPLHLMKLKDKLAKLAAPNGDGFEHSKTSDEIMRFLAGYLEHCAHTNHPGYVSHQVNHTDPWGAVGDFVNGVTNNSTGVYELGPAGCALDRMLIEQLLEKVGWHEKGGGTMVNGGSLGNLTALLAARARMAPDIWGQGTGATQCVFLVPETSHYCVKRAVAIMGHGEKAAVAMEVDESGRVRPELLDQQISGLRKAGQQVVALCANACATATGLFDDLVALGEVCQRWGIWFHVDAAHGGGALYSQSLRHLLKGVEAAHSVVMDMHKLLHTPSLCTALLYREAALGEQVFQQRASYLDHESGMHRDDSFRRNIECTKTPVSLKFFLVLLSRGEQGLAQSMEGLCALTREFYHLVQESVEFSSPYPPQCNILLFSYNPAPEHHQAIRQTLMDRGDFYITQASLGQDLYLRVTISSPNTSLDDLRKLLVAIGQIGQELL